MTKLSGTALKNCFTSKEQKKEYNQELFTHIAPKYNSATRILSFYQDSNWKKYLVKTLPDISHAQCLDVACGTGDITRMVADKYPTAQVWGLDITQAMLTEAKKLTHSSRINYMCQDMCATSFNNNSFDIITAGYALRNAPDIHDALTEISRLIKPNGFVAVLDFSKFNNNIMQKVQYYILKFWGNIWGLLLHGNYTTYGYIAESLRYYPTQKELIILVKQAGFTIVKQRYFFLGVIQLLLLQKEHKT